MVQLEMLLRSQKSLRCLIKEVTSEQGSHTTWNEVGGMQTVALSVSHNPKYIPDHKFNGVNQRA